MKNIYKIIPIIIGILLSYSTQNAKAQVSQAEFDALVALYISTGGKNWINKTNWNINGTKDVVTSAWYGITVEDNKVTKIDLSNNGLTGHIPDNIGNFINLKNLRLNNNELTYLSFAIGLCTNLEIIDISKPECSLIKLR